MRKSITALLVTAALVGSSGAMAQRWHGGQGNNNGGGNGGQSWHGNGGGNGGQSRHDNGGGGGQGRWSGNGGGGGGGQGRWSGGSGMGGSSGAQFRMQSQNNGSGGARWGGRGSSNFQGGSNVQVQQSWQGGGDNGRPRWGGGNSSTKSWSGNGAGWNNNDGGRSSRHYRQDQSGVWRNQGDNDNWRKRSGNWNNGGNWNGGHNWNNGGRHDDWRSWRNSNRDLFRLRPYHGPRGYSYRRFYRGYTIDPFFYDQQYWIDDPYQYRLPEAYGPYRWVRYYNDALLVNIYTGEIEDVITDFFW